MRYTKREAQQKEGRMANGETAPRRLPIGVDDYEKLVEGGYWFADKTLMVKDLHYAEFDRAREAYATLISLECARHPELAESPECDPADRAEYARLRMREPEGNDLEESLTLLTRMLHDHWGGPAGLDRGGEARGR